MATAAAPPYAWPTSPPNRRSSPAPDTTSPVYPGRPIRPMPKRRIRDRLSAEHAATIDYPPQPASSSPIFGYPYGQGESETSAQAAAPRRGLRAGSHEHVPCVDCGHEHSELESEEEDLESEDGEVHRHPAMQFSPDSLQMTRRDGEYYGKSGGRLPGRDDEWTAKSAMAGHHHHASAALADGYDSFENMSNKKKRKIPQSGTGGHGHSNSLSADMANITLSPSLREVGSDLDDGHGAYAAGNSYGYVHNSPGGGAAAAGLSGPGRGRYGRSGRGSMDRRPLAPVQGEPGIISAAIANAAQQMPSTPIAKGQENISMLQQHAASKTPPQKTDFTFTPEGGENRPVWPGGHAPSGPSAYPPHHAPPPGRAAARPGPRGVQTSPNAMNGAPPQPGTQQAHYPPPQPAPHNPNAPLPPTTAGAAPPPAPAPKPRKPRNRARTYDLAARRRKLQKEYSNYQSPPKREDIWICEFCEYESIFGAPPTALIWDYERKDAAERKRLEERRRLLEKAKMKGRKGGRGKKGKGKGGNNAPAPAQPVQEVDEQGYDEGSVEGEGEYYDEQGYGYDEHGRPIDEHGRAVVDELDALPPPPPDLPPLHHKHQNVPGAYPEEGRYGEYARK